MSSRRSALLLVLPLAALVAGGCSGDPDTERRAQAPPSTGPYVSVAVDNHFHDVHQDDNIEIAADRSLVVKNQGHNLHNVTFSEAGVDVDLQVGEEWELGPPLSDFLEPGDYTFFCKYHAEQGMIGYFTLIEE